MALSSYSMMESTFVNTILSYRSVNWNFEISLGLKCLICKLILIDPIQTDCGCRYCRPCIDEYLRNGSKKCLGDSDECSEPITSYITDKATNKEISMIKVKCLYIQCIFEDTLKNISIHLINCDFRTIKCVLCELEYQAKDSQSHMDNDCLMREIECPDCHSKFTHLEFTTIHTNVDHEELCSKYMVECPYQCDVKGKVSLSTHRRDCKNMPSTCLYNSLGCKTMIVLDKMNAHLEKENQQHCTLLVTTINQLKLDNEELKKMNASLKEVIKSLSCQFEALKIESEKRNQQLDKIQRQGQTATSGKSETVFRNGKYMWKLSNFSKLKEDAAKGVNLTIISDSFYTSEFGYRMSLKVYPYGDGLGKGTHLSVFFVLMRGEYDELLSWPFKNKVTLTILEDFTKSTNHSDTFKPDARSICYQKPEDEFNIASGSPKFISFTDLSRFLKNDTLFLQIHVLPL